MMKQIICALIFSAFFLDSCVDDRCAKLEFVDSVKLVQLNIVKLDSILSVMNNQCNAQYDVLFNQDTILIRNRNVTFKYNPEMFCHSDKKINSEFSQTLKFLKRNHINAVFKENNIYVYNFDLCNPYNEFELIRYIVVREKKIEMSSHFRILDKNEKLILIAPNNL